MGIRRLKKENKMLLQNEERLKFEVMEVNDIKSEIENKLALKKWEHQKDEKQKNEKLKSVISRISGEMEGLYEKLERKENGYNAAIGNAKRESLKRQRLEKDFDLLQQRYIVDTQEIKSNLLENQVKNQDFRRYSKKMKEHECKTQQLLKNELERSARLEDKIKRLSKELRKLKSSKHDSNDDDDRVSDTFEAFNVVNNHNQQLLRENKSLKSHLDHNGMELDACKQNIIKLSTSLHSD